MRYEKKYRIEHGDYDLIFNTLMNNTAGFSESYPDRYVNSIYYDDINYRCYNSNIVGQSSRIKYRVRWYSPIMHIANKPILEKKIKENQLGTKEYFNLDNFDLNEEIPIIHNLSHVFNCGSYLEPMIIVRYKRTYLESYDRKIRATIDRELNYHSLYFGANGKVENRDNASIVEIKYLPENQLIADECMQQLPYRITKNSKYVSAMKLFLQ